MNPLPPTLLAALATAAPCQTTTPTKVSPWPPAYTGAFSAAAAGDFLGSQRPCALVARGGALHLLFDPAVHVSVSLLPVAGPVSGVVTFPPRPATPGHDRFVVATAGGLRLATLDASGAYSDAPLLDAGWSGSTHLSLRRAGAGQAFVLAAIPATGTGVIVGGGPIEGAPPATVAVIRLNAPVLAATLVDWDHDGALEVVAATATALLPFELDGSPLPPMTVVGTVEATAALQGEPSGERLAVVTALGDDHWLTVVDAATAEQPVLLDVPRLQPTGVAKVTGLATADLGADGDTDLLVAVDHAHASLVLDSHVLPHPSAPFVPGQPQDVLAALPPPPPGALADVCPPLWYDFDRTGLADVLWLFDSTAQWALMFDAAALSVSQSTEDWVADSVYTVGDGSFDLYVPAAFVAGASEIEVVAWHQSDPTASAAPALDPAAVFAHVWDVPPESSPYLVLPLQLKPPGDPPPDLFPAKDHYYLEMRTRAAGSSKWSPSLTAGWTLQSTPGEPEASYLVYLDGLKGDGGKKAKVKNTRADHIGGILTRKELPPFPPGPVPDPTVD